MFDRVLNKSVLLLFSIVKYKIRNKEIKEITQEITKSIISESLDPFDTLFMQ